MRLVVKTLRGGSFDIDVSLKDKVIAVKMKIEEVKGKEGYAFNQLLLIHQGKVLSDDTTLEDNNVTETSFVVAMPTKGKSSSGTATSSAAPQSSQAARSVATPAPTTQPTAATPAPEHSAPIPVPPSIPDPAPEPTPTSAPERASTETQATTPSQPPAPESGVRDPYGQAASNLVAGSGLETTIQNILEIGGGSWDRETVISALRAAFNNPERAIEYLYSGIPTTTEQPVARIPPPAAGAAESGPVTGSPVAAPPSAQVPSTQAPASTPPSGPNSAPLNLFPQGMPNLGSGGGGGGGTGPLEFLRSNPQFQALRSMVQANPQILQAMLQELGAQNPQLLQLINSHPADFLNLINESNEGMEGMEGLQMPQAIQVTQEEREAIDRLEGMGFERALVIEAFFACDKNEQLAANYLLEHAGDLDD